MNKLEKLKIDIWEGLGKHSKGQFLSRERLHRIIDTAYTLGQQSKQKEDTTNNGIWRKSQINLDC